MNCSASYNSLIKASQEDITNCFNNILDDKIDASALTNWLENIDYNYVTYCSRYRDAARTGKVELKHLTDNDMEIKLNGLSLLTALLITHSSKLD